MREEIRLIDEYDRACHGRAYAEFGDVEEPPVRAYRVPLALIGAAAALCAMAVAALAEMPAHIHPNGPPMTRPALILALLSGAAAGVTL